MLAPLQIGETTFDFTKPYVMGILNLTPDSFSDQERYFKPQVCFKMASGKAREHERAEFRPLNEHVNASSNAASRYFETDLTKALKQIEKLIIDGADIIDIGAESTRPGAPAVPAEEEIQRLKPVLEVYKKHFNTPLSLDTTKCQVAKFGLDLGVDLINDISGLKFEPELAKIVASYNSAIILMHTKGTPKTMQIAPTYDSVVDEVMNELGKAIRKATESGIKKIIIDPGIGFGKTLEHNLTILNQIDKFLSLNCPILVGTSRKSFLGQITGSQVFEREAETISSVVCAYLKGAHFFRVHDVKPVKKALAIAESINSI